MSERQNIQAAIVAIISWLRERGYCVWRCNLGGLRKSGKPDPAESPMAGFPHIGAVHRQHQGRLIGIVVVKPRSAASHAQRDWQYLLTAEGALVIIASSVAEVERALRRALPAASMATSTDDPLFRVWGERDGF